MILVRHLDVATSPILATLEVDSVIVDPPYSSRVHDRALSNGAVGASPHARDLGFASLTPELRAAIAGLAARARRWTCIFSDLEGLHAWQMAAPGGLEYVRAIPWVRWSQPQLSGDRPPSGAELVICFHPPRAKRWSGPGSLVCFDSRSLRGSDKHPTEKPLDLMLSLVSWFSDVCEVVCDPCCGSGTTGLAARILSRDALLFDRNPAAVRRAEARTGAPLTPRDRERCERWIAAQEAWLAGGAPDTAAGRERYARAAEDTRLVREAMK